MNKAVSHQTVVILAVLLALLVIGGTFLVVEQIRDLKWQTRKTAQAMQRPASVGQVTVYVTPPEGEGGVADGR